MYTMIFCFRVRFWQLAELIGDNNLQAVDVFVKYLKENCSLSSDKHFIIIYFPNYPFVIDLLQKSNKGLK